MKKKEILEKVIKLGNTFFYLLDFNDNKKVEKNIINKIVEFELCKADYLEYDYFIRMIEKHVNETKKKNYNKLLRIYKNKMLYYIHKIIRLYYS